jgi:hypothetical protein
VLAGLIRSAIEVAYPQNWAACLDGIPILIEGRV